MDKGYESILKCLDENEKIIFTTDKNFKFGEKNLLVTGEKFFCISNLGRIYIADKNRRLKAIKVSKYDYKEKGVKFNVLNKENIVAINSRDFTDNRSESFIINMKLNDFTEISKKIINNPFVYDWSKYSIKIDDGEYESALINLDSDYISINTLNYKVNLHFLDIIDFKAKDNAIHIISNSKEAYNILIYAFNKDIKIISDTIENAKGIKKSQVPKSDNVVTAKTVNLDYQIDATIIDTDGSFREELDKTISNYYKNEFVNNKIEDINREGLKENIEESTKMESIVDIEIKKPEFETLDIKNSENKSYGKLYGDLNSINYKGRQAEVVIDDELKIFDKELNKELISMSFNDYKYTKNDTVVILKKENNMMLLNLEEQDLDIDKVMTNFIANTEYIGYTTDFQPFEINFVGAQMILSQSEKSIVKRIEISQIADVNLLEENLNFQSIAITLINSEIYRIFVMRASIKSLLREIYKLKSHEKYIECGKLVRINTLKNMIEDELLVLYFGDIVKLKNTIDDFYKSDTKNKKSLIENLYNTTVKLNKFSDLTSMYYFEKFNVNINLKMLKTIQELRRIENELSELTKRILGILFKLNTIKNMTSTDEVKTTLNDDMCPILEKVGLKLEDCVYKSISLTSQVSDYNFDNIIKEIANEINTVLSVRSLYYSNILKCVINELGIEEYLTDDDLINNLVDYFVNMQLKSKIDNKTRLKDILSNVKKCIICKEVTLDFINILDLVSF